MSVDEGDHSRQKEDYKLWYSDRAVLRKIQEALCD